MKSICIITLICLASCMNKDKEQVKSVYDEAFLKAFVLETHAINESNAISELDSIVGNTLNDSIIFRKSISFLETPFSNPNSDYRNQNLYSKLLQAKINSKWYNSYEKKIALERIKLLQQNNIGKPANDFTYITPSGNKKRMHDIKANYLLLFFYNPECNACKEMINALTASFIINQKLKTGDLKIICTYTEKDEKLWLNHLNQYPMEWIQGKDDSEYLFKSQLYDLRAIPTVYLLDKNKNVLLKDCLDLSSIEKILSNNSTYY